MRVPRPPALLIASALGALVAAPGTVSAERGALRSSAVVKVSVNKKLGTTILVDARGFTLYLYTADQRNQSQCVNDAQYHCSKAWPPLRSSGKPRAGRGVKAALLGTIKRKDGAPQVTYNGHPLYTDAGAAKFSLVADAKPGDTNGQAFLGIWFAVSPGGKSIAR
jgi:predicted lipoprotein with Yx(FWY)xxD motif